MRKILLTMFLSLALCGTMSAQVPDEGVSQPSQFTGTVVDEMGKPFQYVTAQLLSAADSSVIASAATDASGTFTLQGNADKALVKLSFIGYNTLIVPVSSYNIGTIKMMPDAQSLSEVVVKGTKPVVKSTVDGLQYIVANDEFAKGMSGEELMARVPMIDVKPNQSGGMDIAVVGKSSTHFLLNGKRLPGNILQSKLKSLRSEDIDRIEVMTIPPAKYAAEGNPGYINIITKKDDIYGFKGNVIGIVRSAEHVNYLFIPTVNYVSPKVEVSLGANVIINKLSNDRADVFTFTDGHQRSETIKNHIDWSIYTVNGLIKYYPIKSIEFGVQAGLSTFHMKRFGDDIINDGGVMTNALDIAPYYPNFMLSAEVYLDWKIDSLGKDLTFTYDYTNNYQHNNDTIHSNTNDVLTSLMTDGSNRYRIDSWKLDLTLPYKKLRITTGLAYTNLSNNSWNEQYNGVDVDSWVLDESLSNHFRYRERTAAAYASAGYEFNAVVSANVGLRLERTWLDGTVRNTGERHTDNYTHLFPTARLLWNMPKGGSMSIEYSMGINRPSFYDLNPFRAYSSTQSYVTGNPYLMPSMTNNIGLNLNYKRLYAVLYENHVDNGIGYITTFDADGTQVLHGENCVTSDKIGLYASYNKDIFKWWNIIVGGDLFYSLASSTTDLADIPSVHGWSAKLEANSTWFLDKAHKLAFNISYTHNFPYYDGIRKFDTWVWFSGSLRYSLFNDRLNLSCSFDDPFNQNFTRTTTKYATYTDVQKFSSNPKSVSITATWNFGGNKVKGVYHQSKNTDNGRAGLGH